MMMRLIQVHSWVCLHDILETIANVCFLLSSYVDVRKISDDFARQGNMSRSQIKVKVIFRMVQGILQWLHCHGVDDDDGVAAIL